VALSKWSLHELVAWAGVAALVTFFLPVGVYVGLSVTAATEENLHRCAWMLGNALTREVVDEILVEDQLALHDALHRGVKVREDVVYLVLENARGEVIAHSFHDALPSGLRRFLGARSAQTLSYRSAAGPMADVSVPVMGGQLGRLHVGLSRASALRTAHGLLLIMGLALMGALGATFLGTHLVAAAVSRPLRLLESRVSRYPGEAGAGKPPTIRGTREVVSLARRFGEMVLRLGSLEEERAAAQERMIHSERLAVLGEFAAGLAHEVNNPLDGMLESVRYLEAGPGNADRTAKYLPLIREGLLRIRSVMLQTLALAKTGNGLFVEECLASDLLGPIRLMLESRKEAHEVNLAWDLDRDGTILCNQQAFSQAVLNLALNAVEAAGSQEDPQILIRSEFGPDRFSLYVEDSGPGVPGDLQQKVFEPFFTTRRTGRGTGLGLSISRQILRGGGGDLELLPRRSDLGGAVFVIRLPGSAPRRGGGGYDEGKDPDRG
jgi:signal transduction histidine kinase